MLQGDATSRSLEEIDLNIHPSRLSLLQASEPDTTTDSTEKEYQSFNRQQHRQKDKRQGSEMKIGGRAAGNHPELHQEISSSPAPRDKNFNQENHSYASREGGFGELRNGNMQEHVDSDERRVSRRQDGRRDSRRNDTDRFTDHSRRDEQSEHEIRRDDRRVYEPSKHEASMRHEERHPNRDYRPRSQSVQHQEPPPPGRRPFERPRAAPFRQRSISRGRNTELFPNHGARNSRSRSPLHNHRSRHPHPQERGSRRRPISPHSVERRAPQFHRPPQRQNSSGWWREDFSVEENYERGWGRVPREYRVFIRDSVSPAYRIVDDPLWRPEYSPTENMSYFLSMIPVAYREGFGEYLGVVERRAHGQGR